MITTLAFQFVRWCPLLEAGLKPWLPVSMRRKHSKTTTVAPKTATANARGARGAGIGRLISVHSLVGPINESLRKKVWIERTSGFSTPPFAVQVAAYSTSYTAVELIPNVIHATIPSLRESPRYTYQAIGSTEAASVASTASSELSLIALGFNVYGYTVSASSMRS